MHEAHIGNYENQEDLSNSIFTSIFSLASWNSFQEVALDKYLSWTIPKIESVTSQLNQDLPSISTLPPEKAQELHEAITAFQPYLDHCKTELDNSDDSRLQKFKEVFSEFLNVLNELIERLEKAKSQSDNVRASFHYKAKARQHPTMKKYLSNDPTKRN